MKKVFCLLLLILILVPSALAITGEIGNARAIISREWNGRETLERTILVRNPNDVKLDIKLEPSDEIKDIVEIVDKEFELQPGEEKNARFNLKIEREGSWSGKIHVFFIPEEGSRVVLSSTIVLSVGEAQDEDEIPDETTDGGDEIIGDVVLEEDDDVDSSTVGFGIKGSKESKTSTGLILLIVLIVIIIVAAIVGLIFLFKR